MRFAQRGIARHENAVFIAEDQLAHAERQQELGNGGAGRAHAVHNAAHFGGLAARDAAGVEESGRHDNGCAVLIVVEHGDIAHFLETALDLEAAGSSDVLQIDAAEAAGDQAHGAHNLVHILRAHTNRDGVHIRERLEEGALPFHHRHAGLRADIPQAEHGGAVRDDGNGVASAREREAFLRVALDFQARFGHAGRIGEREIVARLQRHSAHHFHLAVPFFMQAERFLAVIHVTIPSSI